MKEIKGRILCVDDDRDTCEMLTILLGEAGYEVTEAQTIAEGLTLARRERFDLILLDWFFHDGTGIELCQMIRAFDSRTPILFYSGAANSSEIKQAMSVGAQGFLVKPVGIGDMLQTVSRFLSNDPGEGPHVN